MLPPRRTFFVLALAVSGPLAMVACKDASKPPAAADGGVGAASTAPHAAVASAPTPASAGVDPAGARAAGPLSSAACKALVEETEGSFRAALAKTSGACKTDGECTQERATCLPGCGGAAFAAKDKEAFAKAAEKPLTQCKQFWDGGCSATLALPMPSCPQYVPACEKGTCVSKMRLK